MMLQLQRTVKLLDTSGLGCCLLAFLLYYNTLDAGFVYDDRYRDNAGLAYVRAILRNPDVLSSTPLADMWRNDFWGTPLNSSGSHGSYRPLCVLTFRLNHWASGFRPAAFHIVNVLLHVVNTGLVVRVGRLLLPRSAASLAALLFAAHPIHTEAVSGIVGRADLLACLFYLLSFICYASHVRLRDRKVAKKQFTNKTKIKYGGAVGEELVSDRSGGTLALEAVRELLTGLTSGPLGLKGVCGRQWGCLALSLLAAAAAMLSKETGVTVLLVCAAYDLLHSSRVRPVTTQLLTSLVCLGVGLCGMLLLRLYLMGEHTPAFATADNPTARCPWLLTRLLTFLYLPVFNLQLLLCPRLLSFDWSMDAVPRINSIADSRNLSVVGFYFSLFKGCHIGLSRLWQIRTLDKEFAKAPKIKSGRVRSCSSCKHPVGEHHSAHCRTNNNNNHVARCECRAPPPTAILDPPRDVSESFLLCVAFLVFPFLPATNTLFYVGFVVAERVLYLPSVGHCLLVALGARLVARRARRRRRLVRALLMMLLVVFGGRTVRRNRDWHDEESLYRAGISVNPPKAYGNLGSVLSSQGRIEEAERAFNLALRHRPNMADVHYNLGLLQQGRGQYEEAIRSYHNAIQCRPSLALAHLNLGQLLASRGRCEEAERVFRRCATLDATGLKDPRLHEDTRVAALVHLGRLHADRGRYAEAVDVYKEAVDMMPLHYQPQMLYNQLGEALSRLGHHGEAESWLKAALDAGPDHVPAHITYGNHLARNKTRVLEAEQWFKKAQRLAPSDPSVYHQYGQMLSAHGRHEEAAQQQSRAAQLAPGNYEVVLGAATAHRQAGRYAQAEAYYRRAVALRPHDSSSHSNLGAILHLSGKLNEAAASYREALRIDPDDVTTLTNLHKLRHLAARVET